MALRNIPGAIFKMSSCFALRDINIVKIESRPATTAIHLSSIPTASRAFSTRHWDLVFYLDYQPSECATVNQSLLSNLHEYSLWIVELGQYYSGLRDEHTQPADWKTTLDVLAIA